jgi:hypothetical protein
VVQRNNPSVTGGPTVAVRLDVGSPQTLGLCYLWSGGVLHTTQPFCGWWLALLQPARASDRQVTH